MKVVRFRSWNLNADKFQDTVNFYRNVLGADERTFNQVNGVDVSRVTLGNMVVGVFDAEGGDRPGVPHHTFDIEGPADPRMRSRNWRAWALRCRVCVCTTRTVGIRSTSTTLREPFGAVDEPSVGTTTNIVNPYLS